MAEDDSDVQSETQYTRIQNNQLTHTSLCETSSSLSSLKRPASPNFEGLEDTSSRKRFKGSEATMDGQNGGMIQSNSLVDELVEELHCGCCSELVYKPVIVSPCQHFFCGSCCQLWIRNGGSTCPACRALSTTASPSRPLQLVLDALLRNAPHKARTEREREQADEIYKSGTSIRFPSPRESSPEPNVNISAEYARPCPHCSVNNPFGWSCPVPIPDPAINIELAWHLDDGLPTGHSQCGNCETFLALRAPSTTRCDFCQVSFCGVGVPSRCSASPLLLQQPHGFTDIGDLIQSSDVYECFNSNTVEVEYMLDYMTTQGMTPRHIYRDIVKHVEEQPRQFRPLIELDLFADVHVDVGPSTDADRSESQERICRQCACEILLWGLKDWWIRERKKGFLEDSVMQRKDCPNGSNCVTQKDFAHAKEFNHIVDPPKEEEEATKSTEPMETTLSSENQPEPGSDIAPIPNTVVTGASN